MYLRLSSLLLLLVHFLSLCLSLLQSRNFTCIFHFTNSLLLSPPCSLLQMVSFNFYWKFCMVVFHICFFPPAFIFEFLTHILCQIISHLFHQCVLVLSHGVLFVFWIFLWAAPFPYNLVFGYFLRPVLNLFPPKEALYLYVILSFTRECCQHGHIQLNLFGIWGDLIGLICLRRRRRGFDFWVGKIPWRRKWQSTPVFLPGKSHGQRSLAGFNPRGFKSWIRLGD